MAVQQRLQEVRITYSGGQVREVSVSQERRSTGDFGDGEETLRRRLTTVVHKDFLSAGTRPKLTAFTAALRADVIAERTRRGQ